MQDQEKHPVMIPVPELKALAGRVAEQMLASEESLPADVRTSFIHVRTALFQRGIYDPVLVRFDSATAPKATTREVAEQLAEVAASLQS